MTSLYLINPSADFPTYWSAEVNAGWGHAPAAAMGDLAIATVAALAPADFDVRLCDENVTPVDFGARPDHVALTGKVSQWSRMRSIAGRFREAGVNVVIGGPFASLCPDVVREHCDVLVRGEIEEIAGELFADLRQGRARKEYVGTRPDLSLSPPGRWELYPNDRTKMGTVQTSRGCPFECEFCDVIEYLGRKQRHKPVANVLKELDDLYELGYRSVFLADDNFTVARHRAKELLVALREWNEAREGAKVTFITQLSIDAAKDEEMLVLCGEAGLSHAFIGIETPNAESLQSAKKRQNLGVDLASQVRRFYEHGIMVYGGMIVGFDSDGTDIFARQLEFLGDAAIPIASLGALVAPAATPLHERMRAEGRLVHDGSEMAAMPWSTNIVPKKMTREELLDGTRWLARHLYDPDHFGERLDAFVQLLGERRDPRARFPSGMPWGQRAIDLEGRRLLRDVRRLGEPERRMVERALASAERKPQALEFVLFALLQYAQVRYMYDRGSFWEAHLPSQAGRLTLDA